MEEQRQGRWNTVTIYLDSYIAANFWLHLLCLYLVGTFIKCGSLKIRKRRLVGAALCCAGLDTGAIVLLPCIMLRETTALAYIISIFGIVLATWISFGGRGIVRNSILVFVVTATLAGMFHAIPVRNAGLFCLVGTLLLPFIVGGLRSVFRMKQTQTSVYEAKIYHSGKEKCLSALMDTGNRLRLYGSEVPVVLVDESYLAEWIKEAEDKMPQKVVYLPYKGVGGKGLLHGVRIHCEISSEKGGRIFGEVAAVAAEHQLFHGCEYQMILQPEVLKMNCVKDTQEGERNVI